MGIDADRVSQQSEKLRTTGMLVIPESPLRLWGSLLGCGAFTVVGVVIILIANQSSSPLLYMLAGIASIGFFGVIGIPAIVRKFLRRSRLIVTSEGVRLERRSGQSYSVSESARWTDIAEFFGEEISPGGGARAQLVVGYVLTPLGQQMRSHDSAEPAGQRGRGSWDPQRRARVPSGHVARRERGLAGPAPAGPPALQCTGACLVRSAAAAGVFPACVEPSLPVRPGWVGLR